MRARIRSSPSRPASIELGAAITSLEVAQAARHEAKNYVHGVQERLVVIGNLCHNPTKKDLDRLRQHLLSLSDDLMKIDHSLQKIKNVPGVTDISWNNWFGGVYIDEKNFFPQFAIDAESYFRLYPEFVMVPEEKAAFMADRTGAVVGESLAAIRHRGNTELHRAPRPIPGRQHGAVVKLPVHVGRVVSVQHRGGAAAVTVRLQRPEDAVAVDGRHEAAALEPRYARCTSGSPWISLGAPRAMMRPKSSTLM